eukprot:1363024-Rhodomonas_salina.3
MVFLLSEGVAGIESRVKLLLHQSGSSLQQKKTPLAQSFADHFPVPLSLAGCDELIGGGAERGARMRGQEIAYAAMQCAMVEVLEEYHNNVGEDKVETSSDALNMKEVTGDLVCPP